MSAIIDSAKEYVYIKRSEDAGESDVVTIKEYAEESDTTEVVDTVLKQSVVERKDAVENQSVGTEMSDAMSEDAVEREEYVAKEYVNISAFVVKSRNVAGEIDIATSPNAVGKKDYVREQYVVIRDIHALQLDMLPEQNAAINVDVVDTENGFPVENATGNQFLTMSKNTSTRISIV